ncbi:hypothetical protein HJFPF1_12038 [Paramyrothecium foliicola]|nr:hypothetical protein HJFPF1_12038 [Paramyrothecium foliicola]
MAKPTVTLIPWDPESPEHIDRLVQQRLRCGWHYLRVHEQWRDAHLAGTKCIYWLAFPADEPRRESYHKMHIEQNPEETNELVDSSKTLLAQPCSPTQAKFLPIGHIALDIHDPDYYKKLGIEVPEHGSYWIKSLYVSHALQGQGIGGAAMNIAERMITEEPLKAVHLLLDTMHKDDQKEQLLAMGTHGNAEKIPNQVWYERRGYRLIGMASNLYTDPDPVTGKVLPCRTVFLRKDIA